MTGSLVERRHFLTPLRSIFTDDVSDWFVGVDRMLDDMARKWDHAFEQFNEYPASHVEKTSEGHYRVLVKAPGYDKSELKVQRIDDELVVRGEHQVKGKDDTVERTMSFEQHFFLAPEITVESAKFDKGELAIEVTYPEPLPRDVQEIELT